jgi:hypothetical protein
VLSTRTRQAPRARSRYSARVASATVTLATLVLATLLPALSARAQDAAPTLKLLAGRHDVSAEKYPREPLYLDLGVFVAAANAPFELWVTRPDYAQPVQIAQRLHKADGTSEFVSLPSDVLDGWDGLVDFLRVDFHQDGELVKSKTLTFCPNSYDRQRVSDEGPVRATYPDGCYGNPFTKGLIWGIDEEWAVNATTSSDATVRLRKGTYDVTVSVEERYVDLFGFEGDTTLDLDLEVKSYEGSGCPECPRPRKGGDRDARAAEDGVPIVSDPDPSTLPDLVALPAWNISARNGRARESISFSATVWAGGAQSMVVEGFRRANQELMDAYQYFYEDGEPVGRARVGEMEFDRRDGHNHWHFLQFARYSLLDETKTEVVRSKKEAFCLAPTDTIDLTLPGATWTQEVGLSTACGAPGALWVREVLPLGYGDTYGQFLPGQAFNITDLPNGAYYIQVSANPLGVLYEQSTDNNDELREIVIKGKPGNRRVEVPLWNGIDTETGGGGKGRFEGRRS